MSDPVSPITPGKSTSEFAAVAVAQFLGVAGAIVPPLWVFFTNVANEFPQVRWIAAVTSILAMLWTVLASLGYAKERTALKKAALAAGRTLVALCVVGSLLAAAPARASGPGVICLRGCDDAKALAKAKATGQLTMGDTQLSESMWFGPGLALLPFVYNGVTKEWSNPVAPAVSYGIWWKPANYTSTRSLLALNLAVTGEFSGGSHLDPLMTITFFDNLTIGGGARINFETGGQRAGVNALFAFGWATSFGGP